MKKSKLIFIAVLVAAPASVFAQTVQETRCAIDSLSVTQALNRLNWARKCGLLNNTGAVPKTGNPLNFFQSTKAADEVTFVGANDYAENTAVQAFSGQVNEFNVNYSYAWSRFGAFFAYHTFQDASGPTLNFWDWSKTTQRAQPLYPSFDSTLSGTGTQLFPPPNADINSPCTLFTDTGGATQWPTGNSFFVAFYCTSSCYTPDQTVRFSTGDVAILDAFNAVRNDVVTLTPDATLDNLSTQVTGVHSYTRESRDVTQDIYNVTTASGGSLSVTNQHPVLVSSAGSGRLVMAEKLREGDELLKADGTPDPIVRVEKTSHFGRVYNLAPTATEHVANILIAQGFLVGSSRFQNDDLRYMNRALLFRAVPDDVMPR
ncbi:MAG TPA: Hint domain-containing protein [Kofleriaceae bacterium]|nr:Hint domain-containing protein [Kofleriaceae bacterium]